MLGGGCLGGLRLVCGSADKRQGRGLAGGRPALCSDRPGSGVGGTAQRGLEGASAGRDHGGTVFSDRRAGSHAVPRIGAIRVSAHCRPALVPPARPSRLRVPVPGAGGAAVGCVAHPGSAVAAEGGERAGGSWVGEAAGSAAAERLRPCMNTVTAAVTTTHVEVLTLFSVMVVEACIASVVVDFVAGQRSSREQAVGKGLVVADGWQ